jgi:hypothetical protein
VLNESSGAPAARTDCLVVLTAPEPQALHFPDVLFLHALHHGILLHLELMQLNHGDPTLEAS